MAEATHNPTPPETSDIRTHTLVQIEKRKGKINRVKPPDAPPIVELHLEPHQRVISIELTEDWWYGDRVTRDWSWTAYIESRYDDVVA